MDTNIYSDNKIKILRARYGNDGFALYIYLLVQIYDNGYYIEWDDDWLYLSALDNQMSVEKTSQILNFLLERSLFDNKLFQSDKVLTGISIQRRYQEGCKNRKRDIIVDKKLWLLKKEDTHSFIKVRTENDNTGINGVNPVINGVNSGINSTKESKVKESKLKESKLKESKSTDSFLLTDEQKQLLINEYGNPAFESALNKWLTWKENKKPEKPVNDFKGVTKILSEDFKKKDKENKSSFDVNDYCKNQFEKYNS